MIKQEGKHEFTRVFCYTVTISVGDTQSEVAKKNNNNNFS